MIATRLHHFSEKKGKQETPLGLMYFFFFCIFHQWKIFFISMYNEKIL